MDVQNLRYRVARAEGARERDVIMAEALQALLDRQACACSPEPHVTGSERSRMTVSPVTDKDRERFLDRPLESTDVRAVFEHWKVKMQKHGRVRLTEERRVKIQARLKDGYSVDDIKRAVDGCANSDFHMARGNYRGQRRYDDLTLILRNGSRLEGFRDNADGDGATDLRKFL